MSIDRRPLPHTVSKSAAETSPVVVGAGCGPCGGGGNEWLADVAEKAAACVPKSCEVETAAKKIDPCERIVPVTGYNPNTIAAGATATIEISLQAPFRPVAIEANSDRFVVTALKYGPADMLVGNEIDSSIFVVDKSRGGRGYVLPARRHLAVGQTVSITVRAKDETNAGDLAFTVWGATPGV